MELTDLAFLLLGAKMGGVLFSKLGQPAIVGELAGGIVLGASALNLVQPTPIVQASSQLGLIFLVLMLSLSMDWSKIERRSEFYAALNFFSVSAIIGATYLVGSFLQWDLMTKIIVGIAFAQTSLPIAVRTLAATGKTNSREGETIIGFQVVNDVVAILGIAMLASVLQNSGFDITGLFKIVLIVVGFFVVMSRVGTKLVSKITGATQKYGAQEALLALALVIAFALAALTEKLGIASFLGVFLAGILLSRTSQAQAIHDRVKNLGESFFIPIFFASIGLGVNLWSVGQNPAPVVLLAAFIIAIKMSSLFLPLTMFGFSGQESLRIGSGAISLSEMSIVILGVGLASKALDVRLYSVIVVCFLVVDLASPMIMNFLFSDRRRGFRRRW